MLKKLLGQNREEDEKLKMGQGRKPEDDNEKEQLGGGEKTSSDTNIRFKTEPAYNEMCVGQCSKCLPNNDFFSPHNNPGM